MFAKCANPACRVRFHPRHGGKFFRFRREPGSPQVADGLGANLNCFHNVEHFWLCALCCQFLTLVYVEGRGVMLKVSYEEFSADDAAKELTAA